MSRADLAVENKKKGMNCAQAVICAFQDYTELDQETLMAMAQTFGAGIAGTMEGTCGSLIGANILLGLAGKNEEKYVSIERAGRLMRGFQERNHSVTCKVLKGIDTGVFLCSCEECVRTSAELLEEMLVEGR